MEKMKLEYGRYYHIYNRGNNRENLFLSPRNYRYFLRLYGQHIMPVAETFAYSLLPNHFHFATRMRTEAEQEAFFKSGPAGCLTTFLSPTPAALTTRTAVQERCLNPHLSVRL